MQIHFKVLCNRFNMAALWEYKLYWIPLGLQDIVVLWPWEALNCDGNMTKLLRRTRASGQRQLSSALNCNFPSSLPPREMLCCVPQAEGQQERLGPRSERGKNKEARSSKAVANPEEGLLGAAVDRRAEWHLILVERAGKGFAKEVTFK